LLFKYRPGASTLVGLGGRRSRRRQVVQVALQTTSLLALSMALGASLGCGGGSSSGDTAHLQGTVTIGGQPLPADAHGSITFRNDAGKAVTAPIVDGSYDSPQTPRGAVKAYFTISTPTGKTYKSERTGAEVPETVSIVPASASGGLDVEVSTDKRDQNFDLAG
jgi:hypothetical protein